MDNWKRLPNEVAAKIVCLLPWLDAVRDRVVSRQWRHLVDSYYTQETHVAGNVLYPIKLYHKDEDWRVWDHTTDRWRRLPPFNFMPHAFTTTSSFWPSWAASHKGLVLMHMDLNAWYVCNPLTRQFRLLPPIPLQGGTTPLSVWKWLLRIHVDSSGKSYIISGLATAGGDHFRPNSFPMLVTDESTDNTWALMETRGGEGVNPFLPAEDVVEVDRFVYVVSQWDRCLMVLDSVTGVWTIACPFTWPLSFRICGIRKLFKCGDRVLGLFINRNDAFEIRALDAAACEMVFESGQRADGDPKLVRVLDQWWKCEFEAYEGVLCIFSSSFGVGVVYEAATRVWRRWSGDESASFEHFEFAMNTHP